MNNSNIPAEELQRIQNDAHQFVFGRPNNTQNWHTYVAAAKAEYLRARSQQPAYEGPVLRWVKANILLPENKVRVPARYIDEKGNIVKYTELRVFGDEIRLGDSYKKRNRDYIEDYLSGWEWLEELPAQTTFAKVEGEPSDLAKESVARSMHSLETVIKKEEPQGDVIDMNVGDILQTSESQGDIPGAKKEESLNVPYWVSQTQNQREKVTALQTQLSEIKGDLKESRQFLSIARTECEVVRDEYKQLEAQLSAKEHEIEERKKLSIQQESQIHLLRQEAADYRRVLEKIKQSAPYNSRNLIITSEALEKYPAPGTRISREYEIRFVTNFLQWAHEEKWTFGVLGIWMRPGAGKEIRSETRSTAQLVGQYVLSLTV